MNHTYSPPWYIWLTDWHFEPFILFGLVGAVLAYYGGAYLRRRQDDSLSLGRWHQIYFLSGILLAGFAILSPLDEIGEHFSFSVHMVQHLLMIIPIPILLLLGVPDWLVEPVVKMRPVDYTLRVLTQPLIITVLFNLTFLGWHIPWLYQWALVDPMIHIVEHLTFIGTALLSWWPVMGPSHQISSPFLKVGYIFIQKLPSTVLGAVLVFAEAPLYENYASQSVRLWGWSALLDQQIGGVLMWVPPGIVYLIVLSFIFFRWMSDSEAEADAVASRQGSFV